MTTITVKVDKKTQRKYGIQSKEIEFDELRRKIIAGEGVRFLKAANNVAAQVSLSKMTDSEIEKEIKSARNESRHR